VTTGTLLGEMADLSRLARWPEPAYRNVQFSSFGRGSGSDRAGPVGFDSLWIKD
jgi:hypothetical protein